MCNLTLKRLANPAAVFLLSMGYGTSHALTIDWVTMDSFTIGSQAYGGGGGMMGTIETAAGSVAVNYDGVLLSSSVLNGYGYWGMGSDPAYMVDGTSYAPPTPYGSQMAMVNGGSSLINVINFSTTVENPVMAIRSLGSEQTATDFVFGATFEILSQGTNNGLSIPIDSILRGTNGDGLIQFVGLFDSLSWVINGIEPGWAGFSIGIENIAQSTPPVAVPEPATFTLLGLGMVGLVASRRKRRTAECSG